MQLSPGALEAAAVAAEQWPLGLSCSDRFYSGNDDSTGFDIFYSIPETAEHG